MKLQFRVRGGSAFGSSSFCCGYLFIHFYRVQHQAFGLVLSHVELQTFKSCVSWITALLKIPVIFISFQFLFPFVPLQMLDITISLSISSSP